jgi:DNA repair photolyase
MSIPTLDDRLARLYEPKAPAPSRRLETLRLAAAKGIPVYAAVAPTFPEMDEVGLASVLGEIGRLNPVTIFHEPINLRGGNIDRMRKEAEAIDLPFRGDVFENTERRVEYAIGQLRAAEKVANLLGLADRFHPGRMSRWGLKNSGESEEQSTLLGWISAGDGLAHGQLAKWKGRQLKYEYFWQ